MKNTKRNRTYILVVSIVLLLIIGRLILPYYVTRSVNKVLADIPGYTGSISGVDIRLIRGAYIIRDLKLFKVEGEEKVPFIDIPKTDLSIEWRAIFKGAIVGEIVATDATMNFIGGEEDTTANQTGTDVNWTIPIKRLMPLQINRFQIVNGSVVFYDFTTEPKVNLYLRQLELLATNLSNAEKQTAPLPSRVIASAVSIGNGRLDIEMDINILKEVPDLDMSLEFEAIDMPALNDFFMAYGKVDVEKGVFNMYSELKIENGKLDGYFKPVAQDVKILSWKNDKEAPLNFVWQSVVSFFVEIFTNQKKDQFATKAQVSGDLNEVKSKVFPTLIGIFKNAFIKAFELNTDDSVDFLSDKDQKDQEKKASREQRKKDRKNQ